MPSFYAEIEINAPRAVVWRALLHKHEWLKWNTFFYDLEPDRPFMQGRESLLSLRRVAGQDEIEVKPRITLIQPQVCLRWTYSAPGFRSEHIFELLDMGAYWTKYTHQEIISGVLSKLFLPFIRQDEQQGLKRMARELKHYSEQNTRSHRQKM